MAGAKHIAVCGAGIVGLCSAHYLAQRGHRVTVIERGPETRDGCSFGNAGMIVPSHFIPLAAPGAVAQGLKWMFDAQSPFYIRPRLDWELIAWGVRFARAATAAHVARSAPLLRDLSFASRLLYTELADAMGNEFELVQRGLIVLCQTPQALEHEAAVAAQANALGVDAEVVSPTRAAELDPAVRMAIAGGVYFPRDCHLTPPRLMAALERRLREQGVEFQWAAEITGWRRAGEEIAAAVTAHGEIAADEFVLAGGSWSASLAKSLGLALPLQAGKGYSLTLSQPRRLPRLCSILAEARVAVTPMGAALRVGGTMELSGLDSPPQRRRIAAIAEAMPGYFPDFRAADFDGVPAWSGLRPCSPDGLPYVGRFARCRNLCAATGHAMMGLSLGPITGRLVAEILSDEKPSLPLELLNPDRFA